MCISTCLSHYYVIAIDRRQDEYKMSTKTYMAKPGEIKARWYVVDASDRVLGRMAAELSKILQGKNKPEYTPHVDTGDFVIVINAANIKLNGDNKLDNKVYRNYSAYPSGQKLTTARKMMDKKPEMVISEAVRRMLPKTKLGTAMLKKLKVFSGSEHDHQAQSPEVLEL